MNIDICLNRILARLQVSSKKVHYVGGNEALPPPLSKEEEEMNKQDLDDWLFDEDDGLPSNR